MGLGKTLASQIGGPVYKNAMRSGDAIKPISQDTTTWLTGIPEAVTHYKRKEANGIWDATKKAHQKADGSNDYAKIAGSFLVAGAAGRIATGGGLYKDGNGNTDVIGIPFI